MNFDRRAFLRSSSLAVLGTVFAPHLPLAAAGGRSRTRIQEIPFSATDQAVFDWIAAYSSQVRMVGGCVLSKLRGGSTEARFIAEITDMAALQALLGTVLPFSDLHAAGNSFRFTFEGDRFAIENLVPEVFASRLSSHAARKRVTFAHDALSYDPATQKLSDPYRALSGDGLKVVHPGAGVAAAFRTILRGWTEAAEFDLKLGADFAQLKRRVLSVPGKRQGLAKSVVATLVEQLTTLSEKLSADKIQALLESRLVSVAISRVLGVSVDEVTAQFLAIKAELPSDSAEAVAWLASLLSRQLNDSTLPDWLGDLDPVSAYRARVALADAREIARNRGFIF